MRAAVVVAIAALLAAAAPAAAQETPQLGALLNDQVLRPFFSIVRACWVGRATRLGPWASTARAHVSGCAALPCMPTSPSPTSLPNLQVMSVGSCMADANSVAKWDPQQCPGLMATLDALNLGNTSPPTPMCEKSCIREFAKVRRSRQLRAGYSSKRSERHACTRPLPLPTLSGCTPRPAQACPPRCRLALRPPPPPAPAAAPACPQLSKECTADLRDKLEGDMTNVGLLSKEVCGTSGPLAGS